MDILISYSRQNEYYAKWLSKVIGNYGEDNNFKVWLDVHDLPFGSQIEEHLRKVIFGSDKVLIILSPNSVTSKWVLFEIETALELENKTERNVLIPILIKEAPVPEIISGSLFVDCTKANLQEINLKKLLRQLATTNLSYESSNDFIFYKDYEKIKADIIKSNRIVTEVIVVSPIIGTFYRMPSPDKLNFVEIGDKIKKGDVLCIVEAMKLFNEIESEYDGIVTDILVENHQPVEFNQPLFIIQTIYNNKKVK